MMCGTAAGSRVTETAPARHRWSNPTETALNWVPPNNTCPPPCNENRVHISDWTTSTTPSREEKINIQNSKRDSFPKGVLRSSTSVDFCASNVSHFLHIYYHSKSVYIIQSFFFHVVGRSLLCSQGFIYLIKNTVQFKNTVFYNSIFKFSFQQPLLQFSVSHDSWETIPIFQDLLLKKLLFPIILCKAWILDCLIMQMLKASYFMCYNLKLCWMHVTITI